VTSHSDISLSAAAICANVKRLGYGVTQSIRLYGEEFEVISDPFPEAGGIAMSVKTKKRPGNTNRAATGDGPPRAALWRNPSELS
jgi:hypothetical protein